MTVQTLKLDHKIARNPRHLKCELGSDAVVMDTESGKYFRLDQTAIEIWERIETPILVGRLIQQLTENFEGDPNRIRDDVLDFLHEMLSLALVLRHETP